MPLYKNYVYRCIFVSSRRMGRNSRKLGTGEQLWKLLDQLGKRKCIFLCIESTYMIYHNKCLKHMSVTNMQTWINL